MPYPLPLPSLDLYGYLSFLCPSPKFFIWNHFRPVGAQDSSWAAVNGGLQLWCDALCTARVLIANAQQSAQKKNAGRAGQCRGHIRYVEYVSVVLWRCRLCVVMKQWLAMNVISVEGFHSFLQTASSGLWY
jgi:hypothetical protein